MPNIKKRPKYTFAFHHEDCEKPKGLREFNYDVPYVLALDDTLSIAEMDKIMSECVAAARKLRAKSWDDEIVKEKYKIGSIHSIKR